MKNVKSAVIDNPLVGNGSMKIETALDEPKDHFEDTFINYMFEDKKAEFSDKEYKADREYLNYVIQL